MRQNRPHGSGLIAVLNNASSVMSIVLLSLLPHSTAAAQETAAGEPVAVTDRFVFYSRFALNLHDRLRHAAVVPEIDSSACWRELPRAGLVAARVA